MILGGKLNLFKTCIQFNDDYPIHTYTTFLENAYYICALITFFPLLFLIHFLPNFTFPIVPRLTSLIFA